MVIVPLLWGLPITTRGSQGRNEVVTGREVKGVLFDFDGTLTEPAGIDFGLLRQVTGCPTGQPILEFLAALEDLAEREDAHRRLHEAELAAARRSQPNLDAEAIIHWCRGRGILLGVLTRNSQDAVDVALGNFDRVTHADFAAMISRDDPVAHKPSPEGVLLAAERMGVSPEALLMVGDYRFDIEAGAGAGALTVFLTNGGVGDPGCKPDFLIARLGELRELPLWR